MMKEAGEKPNPAPQRRRRHYLDHSLQGWMLAGLVLMETALFTLMLVLLYQELNVAVEHQLYSAHMDPAAGKANLLDITLRLLGLVVLVNLIAVFLADRVWQRQIGRVTGQLRHILSRAGSLDFRGDCTPSTKHAVLTAACRWYRTEADRARKVRQQLAALKSAVEKEKPPPEIRERLEALRKLLIDTP